MVVHELVNTFVRADVRVVRKRHFGAVSIKISRQSGSSCFDDVDSGVVVWKVSRRVLTAEFVRRVIWRRNQNRQTFVFVRSVACITAIDEVQMSRQSRMDKFFSRCLLLM